MATAKPTNNFILAEVAAIASIWGLVAVSIKMVSGSPLNIGLARLAIGLPFFFLVPGMLTNLKTIRRADLAALGSLGLIFFLHWTTYFYGIKFGGPTVAVLGLCTYGIHLMVLSAIFLGKNLA